MDFGGVGNSFLLAAGEIAGYNMSMTELKEIRKHIATLNDETGEIVKKQGEMVDHVYKIKISMAELKTDMCWLKRSYWLVAGASVGALISSIFGLISGS